jgi:hypothetical protein
VTFYELFVWDGDTTFSKPVHGFLNPRSNGGDSHFDRMPPRARLFETPPPDRGIELTDPSTSNSFDIWGMDGSSAIQTSHGGYSVKLYVGTLYDQLSSSTGSALVSGVVLSMNSTLISPTALLLQFKLRNDNDYAQIANISISSDVHFYNADDAPCYALGTPGYSSPGFRISDSLYNLTFICRGYPLVTNVSAYWYGHYNSRSSSYWTQSTASSY